MNDYCNMYCKLRGIGKQVFLGTKYKLKLSLIEKQLNKNPVRISKRLIELYNSQSSSSPNVMLTLSLCGYIHSL